MFRLVRACCVLCTFVLLSSCKSQQPLAKSQPSLIDGQGRTSLGYLKHRSEYHSLRDLTDPAFRASHNEGFVSWFDPHSTFALHADVAEPRFITTWAVAKGDLIFPDQTRVRVSHIVSNAGGEFEQMSHGYFPHSSSAEVLAQGLGEP